MITRLRMQVGLLLGAGALAIVAPAAAHHSAAAAYDETKKVEAQGTVTRILVKNPHSWVFLDSTDDKGQKIEWQIEMGGVPSMAAARSTRFLITAVVASASAMSVSLT